MRVLFTASDWPGHYFCMVPQAWAMRAAGHDVVVACPPGQAAAVRAAGLVAAPVLGSVDMVTMARMFNYLAAVTGQQQGMPLHPYTGQPVRDLADFDVQAELPLFQERSHDALRRSYDGAVEFARAWRPELVLHDLTAPEGALVAALRGVPSVYHPPGLFGTAETEPGVDLGDGDPSGSFPRYGLPGWNTSHVRHVIDPSPPSALPPHGDVVRLGVRYVPYNGAGTGSVPPSGRPRVCVLWGRSAAFEDAAVPALRAAVAAALDEGADVVLTTSSDQAGIAAELPEQVRVVHDCPIRLLLAESAALVHHGSVNSLLTAAAMGVPQLALPRTDDTVVVSARMAVTGAVRSLPARGVDPADVGAATREVLTQKGYRQAAAELRDEIAAQPSPADLVERLAELGRDRAPVS